ncbi:auxin efflux carrier component 5-like [Nicotiana sylvestris]|uniref:Auxin efflux carrier component 8 n=1 Tax=Nicotiana sylvestris TaxID=4096 RepID=A0A1U7X5D0_NICSY|nr:PREDICTED: putative auxin efflux carrier component 8 [Nicotiana sylvestris]
MIGWADIYKVVEAMAPLYVALGLGYGSVKWWHKFSAEHCDAINRLNYFFVLPFFTFDFISQVNPYKMSYLFICGDLIAKAIIGFVLTLWANFYRKGNFSWSITSFSFCSLTNALVIGIPVLHAMSPQVGVDLVIQSLAIQFLIWSIIIQFMMELRNAKNEMTFDNTNQDLEGNNTTSTATKTPTLGSVMKVVWTKLSKNPNFYACFLGIMWSLVANSTNYNYISHSKECISIMSKAGSGIGMFTIGVFVAMQEKIMAGGTRVVMFGLLLRFVVGPATMTVGSFVVGLHGNVLRAAILQAALPPRIASFVLAKEYGVHPEIVSAVVIIGILVSLSIMIAYYAISELTH